MEEGQTVPPAELRKVQESLDRVDKSIGDLTRSINNLTATNKSSARRGSLDDSVGTSSVQEHTEEIKEQGALEDNPERKEEQPLQCPATSIPRVRRCNWEQFKNRYSDEEGRYAIEVLEADDSLSQQWEDETLKRGIGDVLRRNASRSCASTHPNHTPQYPAPGVRHYDRGAYREPPWIHRIRINSRSVMELLGSCSDKAKSWKAEPRTFIRPFRYLLHFHDEMKQKVEKAVKDALASSSTRTPGTHDQEVICNPDVNTSDLDDNDKVSRSPSRDTFTSQEALNDLQCYMQFMDEELVPMSCQFDNPDLSKPQHIRFHDLEYLFKFGDYIYVKNESGIGQGQRPSTDQMIQKTYWSSPGSSCACKVYACEHLHAPWSIACYSLDYDGYRYGGPVNAFTPRHFLGEKEITQLEFFPVRFLKDAENIMAQARSYGANFVEHVTKRYSFYSGWSLIKGPDGKPLVDPKSNEFFKNPEHVESDVLVDLAEAFDSCPQWRPHIATVGPSPPGTWDRLEKIDNLPVIDWANESRSNVKALWTEKIVLDMWIHEAKFERFLEDDPYLTHAGDPKPPSGDDLALLPRRIFAYAVWDRKFVPIDSRYLKRSQRQGEESEAFEQLQILDENKRLITALLQSHFRKKELELQGIEVPTQDLIRGKGRGIVILLHGVPGVGKTATAEAVAQKWKKPLFPITCGDLGFTPEKVETSLKEIFRLAHRWDCVLLLDEADVFIAQREKNGADLQRNALVSVFLRMLEYYNGVLFLTTNRVGVLDEAIKSRVHLHLKYNQLNKDQTVEIFKHNIKRLRTIEQQRGEQSARLSIAENDILAFARRHYDQHAHGSGIGMWNGRQIRNAFLIAASLAHHDGDLDHESDPTIQKQLRSSHFELVHKATMSYDQDRAVTLAGTDSELAWGRSERNDGRTGPISHGSIQTGASVMPSHYQGPHYIATQHSASPNSYGTSQSAYPIQHVPQNTYNANPQSYAGPTSEPRFSSPANDPRSGTIHVHPTQHGFGPNNP